MQSNAQQIEYRTLKLSSPQILLRMKNKKNNRCQIIITVDNWRRNKIGNIYFTRQNPLTGTNEIVIPFQTKQRQQTNSYTFRIAQ